jgi:hypothetical protein
MRAFLLLKKANFSVRGKSFTASTAAGAATKGKTLEASPFAFD